MIRSEAPMADRFDPRQRPFWFGNGRLFGRQLGDLRQRIRDPHYSDISLLDSLSYNGTLYRGYSISDTDINNIINRVIMRIDNGTAPYHEGSPNTRNDLITWMNFDLLRYMLNHYAYSEDIIYQKNDIAICAYVPREPVKSEGILEKSMLGIFKRIVSGVSSEGSIRYLSRIILNSIPARLSSNDMSRNYSDKYPEYIGAFGYGNYLVGSRINKSYTECESRFRIIFPLIDCAASSLKKIGESSPPHLNLDQIEMLIEFYDKTYTNFEVIRIFKDYEHIEEES
jgi:hypothetical protein